MAVKKAKTKQWFSIVAPKYFNEIEIGKTLTSDPQSLINRKLTISAVELTNNLEKYYLKLTFKVVSITENKALTEFDGSECLRDYISRMVVRRVRRVDSVQDLMTKDGKKIRVKGIAIIRGRIKSSIQRAIRSKIEELIKLEVQNSTLEEFVKKILSDEIKNKISKEVKKVYPLRNFEIRKTEVLS